MLDPQLSRARQHRLLAILAERRLDAAVVALPHHVYYLSAHLTGWQHQSAFILFSDGRTWLTTANRPAEGAAADDAVSYEANWAGTLRQEQPAVVGEQVVAALKARGVKRVGVDASAVGSQALLTLTNANCACKPIDPDLWQLRRRKDPDELALMRKAVRCCEAMYARAREIIEPGIPELRVFAELHAAAVKTAGEPLSALLGNDYACGVPGGPARGDRGAGSGEIYILDLGPAYRGYFADNCRAFAVDRRPTDAQLAAWQVLVDAFAVVERLARPGARCRDIYTAVDAHIAAARGGTGLVHHLGHGVGLQPHEFPHLNPRWDDVLVEGEVFTAEPGIYAPELAGGIRLENDYLVTADGVEPMLEFPLSLV